MNKITREIQLFTPKSKPTPSADDVTLSIDVCIIDESGMIGVAYYNFKECEWRFHTDTLVDYNEKGNETKWMWYYSPVNMYDFR